MKKAPAHKHTTKKPVHKKVVHKHVKHTTKKKPGASHHAHHPAAKKRAGVPRPGVKAGGSSSNTKKATIGGQCAWLAFGVKKPWYRRGAQRMAVVADLAGYVRTEHDAQVVGLEFGKQYHAARVLDSWPDKIMVDLWGAPTIISKNCVMEGYRDGRTE